MSRKGSHPSRGILPDPKYGNVVIARFVNMIMRHGKKAVAESILYGAIDEIKNKNSDAVSLIEKALGNVAPVVEVKSRRVGGATYQIPMEPSPERKQALAMRWLIENSRKHSGRDMAARLAGELMDAARNEGATIKKREDTHRMAEANQAFAHFRY